MAHFLVDATSIKFGQNMPLLYLIEKEGIFMGIRRERLRRKTASGTYDTIHLETSADIVLLSDGSGSLEDELAKVKPIEKGGTGASTGSGAMYNLIAGCSLLDQAADDDYLIVLDVSEQTCKKISVPDLVNYVGGGSNPNWPDKSQLTLGNTVTWAGYDWIVSHKTADACYLTLKGLSGNSTWTNLQSACTSFARKFTEEQKACLKSVRAGNTHGIVFVATEDQMDGGFSYFNSIGRRNLNEAYWTSTEINSGYAWYVDSYGNLNSDFYGVGNQSNSYGFRPSVCIDLTLYN